MHGLHWPDAVLSYLVVALAIGFPIVVALAWIFDVNAGHIERTPAGTIKGARAALILAAIGIVAAAPGVVWYFVLRPKPAVEAARPASIAVLPFANLSGEKENEYFSDGVTEEIINALANVDGVHVVARTSAFSYKGKNVNVRQIGEELNVATVLEGSVRREGNELRVVAQLINAADGYHLWSKTYDRELKGVFSLEDELARAIVQALKPKLVPAAALVQESTSSSEAHDLYLRGRYFWGKRTKEGIETARGLFEQAIAIDPKYALAWSGVADCYLLSSDYGGARIGEVLPKAKAAAQKALEIDDSLAEAHASLGSVLYRELDWSGAARELRRAVELRPSYATGHQWYSAVLRTVGRADEELHEIERARELDPTSAVITGNAALTYYNRRDYDRALTLAKRALDLDSRAAPRQALLLAQAYKSTGRFAEALATLDRWAKVPMFELARADVLADMGDRAGAERILVQFDKDAISDPQLYGLVARVHVALGDNDQAFLWLNRAVEARSTVIFLGFTASPWWDPLRADPRYHQLLKRMNLE
jgi:TolB-like protein/Tfp pilus assembly protein PilF